MNNRLIFYVLLSPSILINLTWSEERRTDHEKETNQFHEYDFGIERITIRWDLAKASGFGLTREMIEKHALSQLDGREACEAAQSHLRKNGIAVRMLRTKNYEVQQFGIFRRGKTDPKNVFAGLRCPLAPTVVLRSAESPDGRLVIAIRDSRYLDESYTFSVKTIESVAEDGPGTRTPAEQRKLDRFPLDEVQRWEACIAASIRIRSEYEVNLVPDEDWSEIPELYETNNVAVFRCHSSPRMLLGFKDESDTNEFVVMVERNKPSSM